MNNRKVDEYSSNESNSDDDNESRKSQSSVTRHSVNNNEVCLVFQQNIMEKKSECVYYQVRKTIRERIFPIMKFCNDSVLRRVELNEKNNVLDMMLADLNRLDDNEVDRAKFWLRYRGEIKSILTIRKTEVSNNIKEVVYNGKWKL